jgi:hypothetical protein
VSDGELEELAAYHPYDLPPKAMHVGPSTSETDATGTPYFRVGKGSVVRIARSKSNGDVYVFRKGMPTIVHTARGWAQLAEA